MAKAKEKKAVSNRYEAMFLLATSHSADMENTLKIVRGIVERHEGKVLVLKKWDERKLSYELGGQKRGLYVICYFEAPGTAVVGIERDVTLSDQVLRVLVTKADHLNEEEMAAVEPQPIQPREERNTWDRPSFDAPRGDRPDRPARGPRHEDPEAAVGKE